MADKELIIGLLEKVRQRMRSERRLKTISAGLTISLIIPVVFKLIDLFYAFRGITVAIFFSVWGIATVLWLVRKAGGNETTAGAAASLDQAALMQDQMKTAYWFILHPAQHPSQAEWIAAQIQRTARSTETLHIETLFPARVPASIYGASALLLVIAALNFLPLSLHHNWLQLEGAPPIRLSRADQAIVDHARKLLDKTEAAKELDKIVSDLQQGKISSTDAQQQLSELRQQIDGANLELNDILDGLTSMASQLGQASALTSAAQAMSHGDLDKAAEDIRNLAEELAATPADIQREIQKNMAQAASNAPAALRDISKPMHDASDALKSADSQSGKVALDNLAQALEQLARKMSGQQQQSMASQQLANLQNSLQREASSADAASDTQQRSSQGDAANGGNPSQNGSPGTGASTGNGQGPQVELQQEQMTKLDMQLKMEGLKGQAGKDGPLQDIEEASKQEKSAMDYRNVPSQLSPAQKDALNQNRLPREQREIVKNYFEEIRPTSTTLSTGRGNK